MAKLRQVGNSLVVTIPAGLAKRYGLRAGDDVEIEPDGDALRVVPMLRVPRHQVELAADHETRARELVRRYHADIHAAMERAERERAGETAGGRRRPDAAAARPADGEAR